MPHIVKSAYANKIVIKLFVDMMSSTFGDCKPWETNKLQDDTNLLNNLKHNLNNY